MSLKSHCTICTDDLWSGTVSTCPCGHTFHEECIKKWLEVSYIKQKIILSPISLLFSIKEIAQYVVRNVQLGS